MKKNLKNIGHVLGLPFFSVIFALLLGGLIILSLGYDLNKAYSSLLDGSVGNLNAFSETLVNSIPLIFTAISYAITYRSGLINLGADGQFYMGALIGSFVGSRFSELPVTIHIMLIFLCAFLGGALWGFIAGFLKVKFSASELITTIMLNYIALECVSFCVLNRPFRDMTPGAAPRMPTVIREVQLPSLLPNTRLHFGLLIGIGLLFVYYIIMWRTTKGYELRVMGHNRYAGEYSGFPIRSNSIIAFSLAGGIAGLGGIVNILGLQYFLTLESCGANFGFTGISVALLGGCSAIGILFSSILFGALNAGGVRMQTVAKVPAATTHLIQGLIILFVISPRIFPVIREFVGKLTCALGKGTTSKRKKYGF